MMNIAPPDITDNLYPFLEAISSEQFWKDCDAALQNSLSLFEQTEILLQQRSLLERQKQKLTTVIEQLNHYIEGTDIQKLNIFDDSSTFSIESQYDIEAKLAYGATKKYQEFQANLEHLSDSHKKEK